MLHGIQTEKNQVVNASIFCACIQNQEDDSTTWISYLRAMDKQHFVVLMAFCLILSPCFVGKCMLKLIWLFADTTVLKLIIHEAV